MKMFSIQQREKFIYWLENWKPIHLCWFFKRMNWKIPKYFIGTDTNIQTKGKVLVLSKTIHRLSYKLYQPDGTYIKTLNEVDILSDFQINKNINGGVGSLIVVLKQPIDDYDEYDAVKNPNGSIKYGNKVKVFLNDGYNTDKQIFYGYLVAIGPQYTNGNETVELTFYGAVSKLSNDYYNNSSTPPYEPTEPDGFYVEETAVSASTIIKNILDNFILQTSNPMVSYVWGTSIDDCANSISYTFDRMKHLDSLRKIAEYLPSTWYWYVDGIGVMYVKDSSSQTEHTLTIGKNIKEIKAHKTIESVINYFLLWNGRSTADASYVFRSKKDATSQSDYDRITLFQQDSEVLLDSVADIRKDKVIAYRKDPKQGLTIEVMDTYDIASLEPGHRVSIRNIKSDTQTTFADGLVIKRISYKVNSALVELSDIGENFTKANSEEETAINNAIQQAQSFSENIQAGSTPITEANLMYSGSNFIQEDVINAFTAVGNCVVGLNSISAILKSYGKTGFNDASVGFWLEKDASNDVKFELYKDASNYLRFNTNTGVLEIAGDIVMSPGSTITWSQISDANPPNSADLSNFNNDDGWTTDANLDLLRAGNLSGGTFISNKNIYSPIIAGSAGYFRDSVTVGASGIGGVIKSYGKTGFDDASAGFWLEKNSAGRIMFELYYNATSYFQFDSSASPVIQIRGSLYADDISSGNIASARMQTNVVTAVQATAAYLSAIRDNMGTITAGTFRVSTRINIQKSDTTAVGYLGHDPDSSGLWGFTLNRGYGLNMKYVAGNYFRIFMDTPGTDAVIDMPSPNKIKIQDNEGNAIGRWYGRNAGFSGVGGLDMFGALRLYTSSTPPTGASNGMMFYHTTWDEVWVYKAGAWKALAYVP